MYRRLAASVLSLAFSAIPLLGQIPSDTTYYVKVFVSYSDSGQSAGQMLVRLMTVTGVEIGTSHTESSGQVVFANLKPNSYLVKVSGPGIEETSARFDVIAGVPTQVEMVRVKRISAALDVPGDARKEAEKGLAALNRGDFKEAQKHYQKATLIYPQFASAYHGLGVADLRSGDTQGARAAFEKSISINDRYIPAYLDLSRLLYTDNKYADAETVLDKASFAEPQNPEILAMLARVELLNGKSDEAIATAHKLHNMPSHEEYAIVHFVAGKAYEGKGDRQHAVAEYQEFLKEAPNAPNADRVRATLQALQKQ